MIGGLIVTLFGVGFLFTLRDIPVLPLSSEETSGSATVTLSTTPETYQVGEEFTLTIQVTSDIPANTYAASLQFPANNLQVVDIIDTNSVVDLWVEEPSVHDAADSLFFAGGSLQPTGFTGTDTLLEVIFTATSPGTATFTIADLEIYAHDGQGSAIPLRDVEPLTVEITE